MKFELFKTLLTEDSGPTAIDYTCLVINLMAASVLIYALFVPFLDALRTRKTFGLSSKFFITYLSGGACMFGNALLSIIAECTEDKIKPFAMGPFVVFLCINFLAVSLNLYILKIKKQNIKEATEKGMSEREYWETVISKQLAEAA